MSITTTKKTLKRILKKPVSKSTVLSLEDSVKKAIDTIKTSAYKGTYVKVELEGQIGRDRNTWSNERCEEFMRTNVSQKARDSLIFDRFYVDGSVDSEYTFTVPLDNVYEVTEFITAFKNLAKAANGKIEVKGAGMHIAILTSLNGNYPRENGYNNTFARNFSFSMNRLLPALFFLGSSNAKSRPLQYRRPKVDLSDKYSAISGRNGTVFEYRVFETCYDKPEAFLDFFCVIAKTLQFYGAEKIILPFFDKIGELLIPDNGYHLSRFYFTANHLKALDLGLTILKPDHKTIEQLKKERNFEITDDKIAKEDEALEHELNGEFELKQKQLADRVKAKKQQLSDWFDQEIAILPELIDYTKEELIEVEIERINRDNSHLTDKKKYIDNKKIEKLNNSSIYKVMV